MRREDFIKTGIRLSHSVHHTYIVLLDGWDTTHKEPIITLRISKIGIKQGWYMLFWAYPRSSNPQKAVVRPLTNQVRQTRHVGYFWRSKEKLMNDVLLWTLTHGCESICRPAKPYIHHSCVDTIYSPDK